MKSKTKNPAGGRFQDKKASLCSGSRGAQAQQFSGYYSKMLNKSSGLACACGAKFNSKRSMRYHARECHKMRCCGRYYPNIPDLRKHKDTAHNNPTPVDEKVVKPRCRFCGKMTSNHLLDVTYIQIIIVRKICICFGALELQVKAQVPHPPF